MERDERYNTAGFKRGLGNSKGLKTNQSLKTWTSGKRQNEMRQWSDLPVYEAIYPQTCIASRFEEFQLLKLQRNRCPSHPMATRNICRKRTCASNRERKQHKKAQQQALVEQ